MNTGRIGIPNGVSGHVELGPLGGIWIPFFETRDSLLAIPGVSSAG